MDKLVEIMTFTGQIIGGAVVLGQLFVLRELFCKWLDIKSEKGEI